MYRELPPPASLRHVVARFWEHTGPTPAQVVLPDACFDAIFPLTAAPAFLVGTQMTPHKAPWVPHGFFGIRFRPGAGFAVLGAPLIALQDAHAELPRAMSSALFDAVASGQSFAERASRVAAALSKHTFAAGDACVNAAMRLLETAPLSVVEARIGYSRRQLERLFAKHAGYTPKQFSRVMRFRAAVAALRAGKSSAVIAAELDYADQAHFTHEFRRFSGATPMSFFYKTTDADRR